MRGLLLRGAVEGACCGAVVWTCSQWFEAITTFGVAEALAGPFVLVVGLLSGLAFGAPLGAVVGLVAAGLVLVGAPARHPRFLACAGVGATVAGYFAWATAGPPDHVLTVVLGHTLVAVLLCWWLVGRGPARASVRPGGRRAPPRPLE